MEIAQGFQQDGPIQRDIKTSLPQEALAQMHGRSFSESSQPRLLRISQQVSIALPQSMLQLDWGRPQSDISECWRPRWAGEFNSSSKERPQCFRYQEPNSRLLLRDEFHRSTVTELPEWGGSVLDLELDYRKVLASRLLLKYGWCSRGLEGFVNLDAEAPTKAGWAFRG